jgi:hypothetical protein
MEDFKVFYFKNKETGIVWSVSNADHVKRLIKDKNYDQIIKEEKKEDPIIKDAAEAAKENIAASSFKNAGLEELSNNFKDPELKKLKRGVKIGKVK